MEKECRRISVNWEQIIIILTMQSGPLINHLGSMSDKDWGRWLTTDIMVNNHSGHLQDCWLAVKLPISTYLNMYIPFGSNQPAIIAYQTLINSY